MTTRRPFHESGIVNEREYRPTGLRKRLLVKCFGGYDNVELWCATIDPILNEHSYIVPGLGDAGDLAFGGKI